MLLIVSFIVCPNESDNKECKYIFFSFLAALLARKIYILLEKIMALPVWGACSPPPGWYAYAYTMMTVGDFIFCLNLSFKL